MHELFWYTPSPRSGISYPEESLIVEDNVRRAMVIVVGGEKGQRALFSRHDAVTGDLICSPALNGRLKYYIVVIKEFLEMCKSLPDMTCS